MNRFKALLAMAALAMAIGPIVHAQVGKSQGLLDANRATQQELSAVPGLDAALVKAIMDKRPFANVTEFAATLTGLGKPQLTEVYGKVFVHANLNTATDEEILSIPAAQPNRILREFKEYRPYKSLSVFHREMRKYWDEAEVSRLEQYVFVPVNLNTATDEEILSIPAAQPNRVLREFKEYRPYTSMDQFHREMRKYWDEKEVSRLQRYVTLN